MKNFLETVSDNINHLQEAQAKDVAIIHEARLRYDQRTDELFAIGEQLTAIAKAVNELALDYEHNAEDIIEENQVPTLEEYLLDGEDEEDEDEDETEDDEDLDELDDFDEIKDEENSEDGDK